MSKKYKHSKPAFLKAKKEKAKRKRIANKHVSFEAVYGTQYPKGGGSLGVKYNKATGEISKDHRADSVE